MYVYSPPTNVTNFKHEWTNTGEHGGATNMREAEGHPSFSPRLCYIQTKKTMDICVKCASRILWCTSLQRWNLHLKSMTCARSTVVQNPRRRCPAKLPTVSFQKADLLLAANAATMPTCNINWPPAVSDTSAGSKSCKSLPGFVSVVLQLLQLSKQKRSQLLQHPYSGLQGRWADP